MSTILAKRTPWLSLALLLIAYASFGWFLSDPRLYKFSLPIALGWVWISAEALTDPLTGLSRLISRWFKSDTVVFLTICMLAGLAAVVLYWMHVFLYVVSILGSEALARLDLKTAGFSKKQSFWVLSIACLTGLGLGWLSRELLPLFMNIVSPAPVVEPKEVSWLEWSWLRSVLSR